MARAYRVSRSSMARRSCRYCSWSVSLMRFLSEIGETQPEVGGFDAAVDLEHLAGHEAPCLGREVEGGEGDVVGRAEPAQRRAGDHLRPQVVGEHGVERFGLDGTDGDGVHA